MRCDLLVATSPIAILVQGSFVSLLILLENAVSEVLCLCPSFMSQLSDPTLVGPNDEFPKVELGPKTDGEVSETSDEFDEPWRPKWECLKELRVWKKAYKRWKNSDAPPRMWFRRQVRTWP